jgi:transcription factor STE12
MYSNAHATMPPPQQRSVAPETFLLAEDAHQSLPPEAIVALQQVDNCKCAPSFVWMRINADAASRQRM